MMLTLDRLPKDPATTQRRKRLGRGNASGHGTTAGRGTKGQRARTGGRKHTAKRAIKSLILHLPKARGFRALSPSVPGVPLVQILAALPDAPRIAAVDLKRVGLLPRSARAYKVIGGGPARKVDVVADRFSATAKAALEKAGGTARLTRPRT
jgi:large subunit ribosomal protein L15